MRDTGVSVETRGRYYPDRAIATNLHPPLHLVLSGPTRETVIDAASRILKLLEEQPPAPLGVAQFSVGGAPARDMDERIPIGIDPALGYPLRVKVLGQQVGAWGNRHRRLANGIVYDDAHHHAGSYAHRASSHVERLRATHHFAVGRSLPNQGPRQWLRRGVDGT